MDKSTLDEIYWPLMKVDSVISNHCLVCGRNSDLNQHHIVWRSWGELMHDGRALKKPTVTLCGFGNHLRDADGRYYCHGLAHHRMLHFRVGKEVLNSYTERKFTGWIEVSHLEYLITEEPTDYLVALEMDGWRRL